MKPAGLKSNCSARLPGGWMSLDVSDDAQENLHQVARDEPYEPGQRQRNTRLTGCRGLEAADHLTGCPHIHYGDMGETWLCANHALMAAPAIVV